MNREKLDRETMAADWDRQMLAALEADGEKLRQLTCEDHGPFDFPAVSSEMEWLRAGTHYMDADGNVKPKPVK